MEGTLSNEDKYSALENNIQDYGENIRTHALEK